MKLVEFTFANIYGDNVELRIRIIEDGLHELFLEYNTVEVLSLAIPNMDERIEDKTINTWPFQDGSFETQST